MLLSPEAVALLRSGEVPKGDALGVARIAGIQGAKRTPDLIPLCHPIALHGVKVDLTVVDSGVEITARVKTADRTGVEMEALTAVERRRARADRHGQGRGPGGGDHRRAGGGEDRRQDRRVDPGGRRRAAGGVLVRALVITVSNRAAPGIYPDRSGPLLVSLLKEAGCEQVDGPLVVPDGEPVEAALRDGVRDGYDVIVTTGGTGLTPTDLTPEMTRRVLDREIPGIAEAIRQANREKVPTSILSRGLAGAGGQHADREPSRLLRRRQGRHGRARADPAARGRPDPRRRPPQRLSGRRLRAAAPKRGESEQRRTAWRIGGRRGMIERWIDFAAGR